MQASSSKGEGSGGFWSGVLVGGTVFGVLGFLFAPQVSRALLNSERMKKLLGDGNENLEVRTTKTSRAPPRGAVFLSFLKSEPFLPSPAPRGSPRPRLPASTGDPRDAERQDKRAEQRHRRRLSAAPELEQGKPGREHVSTHAPPVTRPCDRETTAILDCGSPHGSTFTHILVLQTRLLS